MKEYEKYYGEKCRKCGYDIPYYLFYMDFDHTNIGRCYCPNCRELNIIEEDLAYENEKMKPIMREAVIEIDSLDFLGKTKRAYMTCPYCNCKIAEDMFFGGISSTEKYRVLCPECGNEFNVIEEEERATKEINMLSTKIRELMDGRYKLNIKLSNTFKELEETRSKNDNLEGDLYALKSDYKELDVCYITTILEKEKLKREVNELKDSSCLCSYQYYVNNNFRDDVLKIIEERIKKHKELNWNNENIDTRWTKDYKSGFIAGLEYLRFRINSTFTNTIALKPEKKEDCHLKDIPKFDNFLREYGAYKKFYDNILKNNKINEIFGDTIPEGYIKEFFIWEDTPEGVKYWKDINAKWQIECVKQDRWTPFFYKGEYFYGVIDSLEKWKNVIKSENFFYGNPSNIIRDGYTISHSKEYPYFRFSEQTLADFFKEHNMEI